MQRFLVVLALAGMSVKGYSQGLYKPRDVQHAFDKNTRSADGKPGKDYWQNKARYEINITALPPERTIRGSEQISYINNSPDTLRGVYIKLFMNIHKPGAPSNVPAPQEYLTSGVHIDGFSVNGQKRQWQQSPYSFTVVPVRLAKPLGPKDSIQLSFDWHYDMSLQSNREGMIDSTTFFLAYFYPRVAVYDDYYGWDRNSFLEDHEFYSDFNDYTVNITVPNNYIVWGTGTLQKPETVLQPEYLKRFQQSFTSDKTINVVTKEDLAGKKVTLNKSNTWQFTASNIPDMAFGLSDHFVWDAASIVVDSTTNRRASVQAAFNDTAKDYHEMVAHGQHALKLLSFKWPGVPYPYEKTTIFQGYAGMEYPMMANDETYEDPVFSRFVAEHELAHTYMPFYMGINENRYGFMDEGWATTFEYLMAIEDMGKEKADGFFKQFRVEGWIGDPSAEQDIPIITPGNVVSGAGFGNNIYGKPALGYLALKDMLGDQLFKKSLHEYMNRWNGKHPTPWDYFNTINSATGKNLDWFWNSWFFQPGYIDLAVSDVKKASSGYSISVKNIGGFPAPADLLITYADGSTETKHFNSSVWEKDLKQTAITVATKKQIKSVKLDGGIFMDANTKNNSFPAEDKKGF
ncbi:M1 family metallopeptidase [Terrimonas sp. NA20]|uniref:M1 family metallopeptidase n=1 Tax=Terrimonas ginsenosidimutans TaxID=2908004 RepID=A0ABS9KZ26_9BACT|nr:M1 family metallopeptidase [Terrimonas ginsenosidimutans]MCG2617570.1 M1 family metallopeptidase [Terrimonas ginsenosidimutans]